MINYSNKNMIGSQVGSPRRKFWEHGEKYEGLGYLGKGTTGSNEKYNYIITRFLIVNKSIHFFPVAQDGLLAFCIRKVEKNRDPCFLIRNYIFFRKLGHGMFTWFLLPIVHVWKKFAHDSTKEHSHGHV